MQQRYYDPLCGCFVSTDQKTAYDTGDMKLFTRYAYAGNNPYKFIDPDGRKYDFPGITPEGRKGVKEAFHYLNKSEVAGGLLKELKEADGTVHIVISPAGSNHTEYDPNTKTLYWDARAGLRAGDKVQTPALGLLHEAAHGVADLKGESASDKQIPGDPYDNAEEKRVIQKIETPAAIELGEPTRNDHLGKGVLVECATCQK